MDAYKPRTWRQIMEESQEQQMSSAQTLGAGFALILILAIALLK